MVGKGKARLVKLTATALVAALGISLFPEIQVSNNAEMAGAWIVRADTGTGGAFNKTEKNTARGVSQIAEPVVPAVGSDAWKGSYIYFGKYDGEPVLFRVLDTESDDYFASPTILLDANEGLVDASFDRGVKTDDGKVYTNVWENCTLRAELNGEQFLNRENGFTDVEKGAIAASRIDGHDLEVGTEAGKVTQNLKNTFGKFVGLNGDKIFVLDVEEACNLSYGYYPHESMGGNHIKKSPNKTYGFYWLRSANINEDGKAGYVESSGGIRAEDSAGCRMWAAPALNVKRSSVLFSSVVSGTAGQPDAKYKLTLLDPHLFTKFANGTGAIEYAFGQIEVPFVIGGDDASKVNRISVLVTDKAYTINSAKILYYSKMSVPDGVITDIGTGTFTMPAEITGTWGTDYHVYVVPEIVNEAYETDYAATPLEVKAPKKLVTFQFNSNDLACTSTQLKALEILADKGLIGYKAVSSGEFRGSYDLDKNGTYDFKLLKDADTLRYTGTSTYFNYTFEPAQLAGTDFYQIMFFWKVVNTNTPTAKPSTTPTPADVVIDFTNGELADTKEISMAVLTLDLLGVITGVQDGLTDPYYYDLDNDGSFDFYYDVQNDSWSKAPSWSVDGEMSFSRAQLSDTAVNSILFKFPHIIDNVALTIATPAAAKVPDYAAKTASGAHYSTSNVALADTGSAKNGIIWARLDNGQRINPNNGQVFAHERTYVVSIGIVAETGYEFKEKVDVKINGKEADEVTKTDGGLTAKQFYPKKTASVTPSPTPTTKPKATDTPTPKKGKPTDTPTPTAKAGKATDTPTPKGGKATDTPTPKGGKPTKKPGKATDTPTPKGGKPTKKPGKATDTPTPKGGKATVTPNPWQDTPTPKGGEPTVTPNPWQDTPTPKGGQPTATPKAGVDTPTPKGGNPTVTTKPGQPTPTEVPAKEPSFTDFVERLYVVALDRASETDGKKFWVGKVENGEFTGADCARFFLLDAPEFLNRGLNDSQFLDILYRTFFDRESDTAGKNYWLKRLDSGTSRRVVVNDFIESTEWCNVCATYGVKSGAVSHKAEFASQNAINFATRLYTCCLGRAPEEKGLNYWSLALTNLEQTGCSAAREFFTSAEFKGFKTSDQEYVKRLYTTFMDREPASSEVSYWTGEIAKGTQTRASVLAFFGQSEEFTAICKKYGIDRGEI